MISFRSSLVLLGILALTLLSCNNKGSDKTLKDSLIGEWEILDALRNGRRTTTLKDGFMRFEDEGKLTTNILGRETTSYYKFSDSKIESDGDFEYNFEIEKLSGDTLLISGKMKVFDMVFYMIRKQLESSDSIIMENTTADPVEL
jgi:hypothetical protein